MSDTPDILEKILARKAVEIAGRSRTTSLGSLQQQAEEEDAPRGFIHALLEKTRAGKAAVIAEIKKASPSRGVLRGRSRTPRAASTRATGSSS